MLIKVLSYHFKSIYCDVFAVEFKNNIKWKFDIAFTEVYCEHKFIERFDIGSHYYIIICGRQKRHFD